MLYSMLFWCVALAMTATALPGSGSGSGGSQGSSMTDLMVPPADGALPADLFEMALDNNDGRHVAWKDPWHIQWNLDNGVVYATHRLRDRTVNTYADDIAFNNMCIAYTKAAVARLDWTTVKHLIRLGHSFGDRLQLSPALGDTHLLVTNEHAKIIRHWSAFWLARHDAMLGAKKVVDAYLACQVAQSFPEADAIRCGARYAVDPKQSNRNPFSQRYQIDI